MSSYEQLDDLLILETSRRNTDAVADLIYQKPELFDELFKIYLAQKEPVSRRAAWVVDTVSERLPHLIENRINDIIAALPLFTHDGLKRHSVKILARSPLPDQEHMGMLVAICFDWLLSPREAVAVKAHCMELLFRISLTEPDIRKELTDTISWRMDEGTPGFKNRAGKILKKLSSIS